MPVMAILLGRKKFQEHPKEAIKNYVESVGRSTAFLAVYTVLCSNLVCAGRHAFGRERHIIYILNGLFASLAVFLEHPNRITEVALYNALYALITVWGMLKKRGFVRRVPQWDTAVFSLSMGLIMSVYQSCPEALSAIYFKALTRIHNLDQLNLQLTQTEERASKCQHEGKTCTQNVTRGFLKTWVIAYLVKYAIGLLPALLSGKLFKNPSLLRKSGGSDTIGFAFFLSSFLSTYKGVLCAMRRLRPLHNGDRLNAFIAGSVAGLTLFLDKNKGRRKQVSLYLFTRSLQFAASYGMKQWAERRKAKRSSKRLMARENIDATGKEQALLSPEDGGYTWEDTLAKIITSSAATFLMSLTASVNIYALFVEPETIPKSYFQFLMQHSGVPQNNGKNWPTLTAAFQQNYRDLKAKGGSIKMPTGVTSHDFIRDNISQSIAEEFVPQGRFHEYQNCGMLHPRMSCTRNTLETFRWEVPQSIKMYAILNAVVALVFQRNRLMSKPVDTILRLMKSTGRSALFLTLYVFACCNGPCLMRRVLGREGKFTYIFGGLMAGPSVLLEVPGRQMELALYIGLRSVETTWNLMIKHGYIKSIANGEVALFCASMGVMMSIYQNDPSVIGKHYSTVLTRLFGRN
ncbi:hypothetical protein BG004_001907 [Podila humilis]|nr:hypothetical protein BG004_001907 [Podila humilis]